MTFVSASGDGWACSVAANIVTCARPSLANGVSSSIQIVGVASSGGATLVNAGSISSRTKDPTLANNTATATVTVTAKADLVVTKTASSAKFIVGQKLTFTISVVNRGPDSVSGARVRDVVPPLLTSVTWTCSAVSGSCGSSSGTGSIDQLVNISVGGRVVFTVNGTPKAGAAATMTNSASATPPAGVVDPNLTNNRDDVTVPRGIGPTRLKVTITPETAIITSGIPIPATVVTKNIGKETARNVITCVSLPPGITVSKADGGFARQGSYCWRTRSLKPGAHVTFKFMIRGDSRLAGRLQLVAQAQASNAPRVGDTSRLIVLSEKVTHQGGYTG